MTAEKKQLRKLKQEIFFFLFLPTQENTFFQISILFHSFLVIIYSLVLCNRSLTCLTALNLDVFPLVKSSENQVGKIPNLPFTSFSLIV